MERTEEDIEQFFDLLKNISITGLRITRAYKADPEANKEAAAAWMHMLNMHTAEIEMELPNLSFKERETQETNAKFHREAFEGLMVKEKLRIVEEGGIECANPLCHIRFIGDRRRKYHDKKCQQRAATNRYNAKKRMILGAAMGEEP